jgi:polyphosphate glucokinase
MATAKRPAGQRAAGKRAARQTATAKRAATKRSAASGSAAAQRRRPGTLAVDVGGSGVKAEVLADDGSSAVERQRIPVEHPCPPERLIGYITELRDALPPARRVSVGFPGLIRGGRIITAPNFIGRAGPGTPVDPKLRDQWIGFDLANAVETALGRPTRVANDADVQGLAVVKGVGFELVITLGTGFGTAMFHDGELLPHLEMSHGPFRKGQTYDEQVGDVARRKIGNERWTKRVVKAVQAMREITWYDTLYIGGGNAAKLTKSFTEPATIVSNANGVLGGLRLWEQRSVH